MSIWKIFFSYSDYTIYKGPYNFMANLGSLGSSPYFLSWLQLLNAESLEDALKGIESRSITFSEKHSPPLQKIKEEDILALMPPEPIKNIPLLSASLDFSEKFGIDRVSLDKAFGITESAITLAAATSWAQAEIKEKEELSAKLRTVPTSSQEDTALITTLSQFISQAPSIGLDALALQHILRQSPAVATLFHNIESDLALKAYEVAEQQIVLTMLEKWIEMEQARSEQVQKQVQHEEIQVQKIAQDMLKGYIEDISAQQQTLQQPALSILVSAVVMGVTPSSILHSLSSIQDSIGGGSIIDESIGFNVLQAINDPLKAELLALTSGLVATATAWATPVVMTLIAKTHKKTYGDSKEVSKQSARAFAVTLATFLTNPAVDILFQSRLKKACQRGIITQDDANIIISKLKIVLLVNALALLYHAEVGGVSDKELKVLIQGMGSLGESSFTSVIVKLIKEQMQLLEEYSGGQAQEECVDAILEKFSTNIPPSTAGFIAPIKAFVSMWDPYLSQQITIMDSI